MKIVLIGGYPKGFEEPFHIKTQSGRKLRKIIDNLKLNAVFFDLWKDKEEENSRIIKEATKIKLEKFLNDDYRLIALGRYIEKSLTVNNYPCQYLPHPASRDSKYLLILKEGLRKYVG